MSQIREELEKLDNEAIAAWNAHDTAKFVSLCSDDAAWYETPEFEAAFGDQLVDAVDRWFAAFPDMKVSVQFRAIDEVMGLVAAWLVFTGTHTGPLLMSDGTEVPATGRRIRSRGAYLVEVENGKIHRLYAFPDQVTLMEQLGLMPAPA